MWRGHRERGRREDPGGGMQGTGLKATARGRLSRARARRKRARGPKPYLLPVRRRQRGAGGLEWRKEGFAHARPGPTSRSAKDRVTAMRRRLRRHSAACHLGGGIRPVAPPGVVEEILQAERTAETRITPQCKPTRYVAFGMVCTAFGNLGLAFPSRACVVTWGKIYPAIQC